MLSPNKNTYTYIHIYKCAKLLPWKMTVGDLFKTLFYMLYRGLQVCATPAIYIVHMEHLPATYLPGAPVCSLSPVPWRGVGAALSQTCSADNR